MKKDDKGMKTYTLGELTDKHIGRRRTPEREQFEFELTLDILGDMVRKVRKEKDLTQEQLGHLVGVKKAQISKIENNAKDVRLSTIVKVFHALNASIRMNLEYESGSNIDLAVPVRPY
jgi:HTH-type transcriptional regulator / antitoxin HipB